MVSSSIRTARIFRMRGRVGKRLSVEARVSFTPSERNDAHQTSPSDNAFALVQARIRASITGDGRSGAAPLRRNPRLIPEPDAQSAEILRKKNGLARLEIRGPGIPRCCQKCLMLRSPQRDPVRAIHTMRPAQSPTRPRLFLPTTNPIPAAFAIGVTTRCELRVKTGFRQLTGNVDEKYISSVWE